MPCRVGLLSLLTFALMATAATAADQKPKEASTRDVMQSIFAPISRVLALSFDEKEFASPKNQAAIRKDLLTLTKNLDGLEEHAKSQDRSFEYVAKSLKRDARQLERRYVMGRYDEANFTLHHMIENCIACHANLPESQKFPPAEAFVAKVDKKRLTPLELAQLQVISRQFDAAMDTYEDFFKTKQVDPWLVTSLGSIVDYLKLSISVKSDFKRPQALIDHLMSRPTTPPHVKMQLATWQKSLKEMDTNQALKATDLASARKLLNEGRALMEFDRDRDGLVQYLTAEAILSRYIRGRADRGADVAEAYYLLGIAAGVTEHSFWLQRGDFFFESAIRLAPSAPFAPKAFRLLEESLTLGYTGSGGTQLPYDVVYLLDELRRLVAQEQK
jgi:hypothetical protein